jgi:hypothetical protein
MKADGWFCGRNYHHEVRAKLSSQSLLPVALPRGGYSLAAEEAMKQPQQPCDGVGELSRLHALQNAKLDAPMKADSR